MITTSAGTPINPRNLVRSFKRLCERANVPAIRLYDLRHTFDSTALWRGGEPKTMASIMGLDPMTVQRVYAHIQEGARRKTMERVAAALGDAEDGAGEPAGEGTGTPIAGIS